MVEFTIPGKPQGKARARTVYNPNIKHSVSYTPEKTMLYENLIKTMYLNKYPDVKYCKEKPLSVGIFAYFPIPKSMSKKRKHDMRCRIEMPTKKPDIDNIAKVVLDALNGIAYDDDTQIVALSVYKFYAEDPRVNVTISPCDVICENQEAMIIER